MHIRQLFRVVLVSVVRGRIEFTKIVEPDVASMPGSNQLSKPAQGDSR